MGTLFGKKYNYNDDFTSNNDKKYRHLDRVVNPNTAIVRNPRMDGEGTTVVFLPYPEFDNPEYKTKGITVPDRLSDEPRDYGPWLFSADGVQRFGRTPVTLLFDNPDDAGFNMREHHPVQLIWDTVVSTVKNKLSPTTPFGTPESDSWEVILNGNGNQNSFGCLNRPDKFLLGYVLIYSLGEDRYYKMTGQPLGGTDSEPPVVFIMPRSTAKTMLAAIDPKDDKEGPKVITGAQAFHFYDRKKNNCEALRGGNSGGGDLGLGGSRRAAPLLTQQPDGQQLAGYNVLVTPTLDGNPSSRKIVDNRRKFEEFACRKLKPWQEVLRGHTPDQCAKVIADHCALPYSILYQAWKDHPEWYSEEMKFKIKNPVTVETRPPVKPTQPTIKNDWSTGGDDFDNPPGKSDAKGDYPFGSTPFDGPSEAPSIPADEDVVDPKVVAEAQARFRARAAQASGK